MKVSYCDDNAVDEVDVKAKNGRTQDNRSSNQSMMENWVAREGGLGSKRNDHNPSWTMGLARDVEMLG